MAVVLTYLSAVCFVIGAALVFAAIATPNWYNITISGQTANSGLFKSCKPPAAGGECSDNVYNDLTLSSSCSRTASDQKLRVTAVIGLTIAGGVLSVLTVALAVAGQLAGIGILKAVALVTGILGAAGTGIGVALYIYTIENWLYCDKSFCDFSQATGCTNAVGLSFILGAVAVGVMVIGFLLQGVHIAMSSGGDDTTTTAAAADSSPSSKYAATAQSPSPQQSTAQQQQASPAGGAMPPPPEGGDWVFVPESQLYWSATEYLYLDTVNQQYYDPQSGMWYDPASGQWYSK